MARKSGGGTVKIRLLFVDDGDYHDEHVEVPAGGIDEYERLLDFLREDPAVLKHLHVDMDRLCAAYRVDA
jgi:hypothetical protein